MAEVRGIKTDTGNLFVEFDDPKSDDEDCISIIAVDSICGTSVTLNINVSMISDLILQLVEAQDSLKGKNA